MKISSYLQENLINLNLKGKISNDVIVELTSQIAEAGLIQDKTKIASLVIEREELHSTGIGKGIAIPHARVEGLDKVIIAAGKQSSGVDFKSRDKSNSKIIFLMLAPVKDTTVYLEALSSLAMLLMIGDLGEELEKSKNKKDFINIFKKYENM